mmetsp:Transcript_15254/g.38813  ORF Transcript_15254/g.38813 Transcript_15254/m.38813 type:complete len:244 (+) Transcript_15254:178-909(+)
MPETPICQVNAAVYYYQDAKWEPADGGLSMVYIYHNSDTNSYRVVAVSAQDQQVVINSAIFKELKYQKLSETFHNWADTKRTYGLNFANDADLFFSTMTDCIEKLKAADEKAAAEQPAPPQPAPPAAPEEPKQPEPPAEPKQPEPPAEPKQPAPPSGRGGRGRGGRGGGSAIGPAAGNAIPAGRGRGGGRGRGRGGAGAHTAREGASAPGAGLKTLDDLKDALVAAFHAELEQAKEEILASLQ